MPFNPASPLSLVFKKYTTIPPPTLISVDVPANTNVISGIGLPNWLGIINTEIVGTTANFYFKVSENSANTLPPDTYTANINLRAINYNVSPAIDTDLGSYQVTLEVQDTVILQVSPTVLDFTFETGGTVPSTKAVQIVSENNWNISSPDSWVTIGTPNGSQNATVQIGIDPSSLNTGLYQAKITVDDGLFTRDIDVYLSISEPQTAQNYLFLNPVNFEFLSEVNVANATTKKITVDTGDAWNAVVSDAWLVLSANNGVAGITDITCSVDSDALTTGVYQATATFTSNGITKKVYVTLRVVSFVASGIQNGELYYSGDRVKLQVGNVIENSFLSTNIESTINEETISFNAKAPYLKGVATLLLGIEAESLIKPTAPTTNFATRIKNDIRPINVNISAFDEQKFTGLTTAIASYQNLKFLKGRTPSVNGRLCYIPQNIVCTNKAKLQLTVVSKNAPVQALLTGAVTATINGGLQNELYAYSFFVNLEEYLLSQGDVLNMAIGTQSVNITIDNDYTELHTIAFLNEWGVYEYFETRGFLTENATVKQRTFSKSVDGKSYEKVIEADEDADFYLNTGFINSKEEVVWLSKILNAKRCFVYFDGAPVEVVLQMNSMQVYETRNHINAFRLRFKKAIV